MENDMVIKANNKQVKELCEKYPTCAKEIRAWIKQQIDYYNKKPFSDKEKDIFNQKIKESIKLINTSIKETKPDETKNSEEKPVINQFEKNINFFTDMRDLAERFLKIQPCYYDKGRNWWLWNWAETKWEIVDDKDILNAVNKNARVNTIKAKDKYEILEALMQVSRENEPAKIKQTWIQFKNNIYDIETGEQFRAQPCWFVTNPIPWNLHEDGFIETPVMDKIFGEWVGEKNVKTLYEILAYCLLPSYPIHRIFCFIGSGMNGKSKFLELLRKFIGKSNCCSTELDILLQSRFEITRLHKKLVCQMGETNFNEMSKTSQLKKLSGGDLIGFEYKRKNPFEENNYAKIIIATNNLPTTTDKTIGFYRRWMIIDFPNQFSEAKDILQEIPDEEYNALALKCVFILKDLIEKRKFTNEGDVEERIKRYEDKSNPLGKFIKEFTEEDGMGYIWKWEFEKKLNQWCKENRFREISDVVIGKRMKEIGIEQQKKDSGIYGENKRWRAWVGIRWKSSVQDVQDVQVTPI